MCLKMQMPDGTVGIICGTRGRTKHCACGRAADLLCDWKMKEQTISGIPVVKGTCDAPICPQHAKQVGPDKHLCPQHQRAYENWLKRHPGAILPPDYAQLSLL